VIIEITRAGLGKRNLRLNIGTSGRSYRTLSRAACQA
jgi:hypothetical protein